MKFPGGYMLILLKIAYHNFDNRSLGPIGNFLQIPEVNGLVSYHNNRDGFFGMN